MVKRENWAGDIWGGTAAMLVALPAAIAFGVTIYGGMGGHFAAYGAIAGILGVVGIGIVASAFGGADRLISAPSAPAAAVMSAFALEYLSNGTSVDSLFVLLMLVALLAGLLQIVFGLIGLGSLIKYMPFPVVSGYLSGVGLYIVASQAPIFLGLPQGSHFWASVSNPFSWQWESIVVGLVTIVTMVYANRFIRVIPAVIIALAIGMGAYFALGMLDPVLYQPNNPFIIGEFRGNGGVDFTRLLLERFEAIRGFSWDVFGIIVLPALTLAALLSIDTLKTCIILDSMTHSFHRSNKELVAQGMGNIVSAMIGGMPGSGTMGPTMVNLTSGASTRISGIVEGIGGIIAFWVLGSLIEWIPVAALAGIMIVIGFRMVDRNSVHLLKSRNTALDFLIIATVALSALTTSLIIASGVGLLMAIVLYILKQIGESVVYRHIDGTEARSKLVRSKEEEKTLRKYGGIFSLYELHGSLFFGTANQLYAMLRNDLEKKKYVIIDMKRVQSVDLTAAHILLQIKDILHEKDGYLVLCRLPHKLPTGDDLEIYFNQVGLLKHMSPIKVFTDLDDAIEWIEYRIIKENFIGDRSEHPLELADFDFFKGRQADTIEEISSLIESRSFEKGETIFSAGDGQGEIFLIRRGLVRIMLPLPDGNTMHLNTMGQGNFFGEFSFLEGSPHYAHAIAGSTCELYVITRESFDLFAQHHKKAALQFMQALAAVLADRLRSASTELGAEYDV